jgi:serine/threonine-protein kinase
MSWATPARKSAQETALELLRAETLGEYEILGELGRGGMATVYLAHDIALDRRVAIKVMSPALLDEGLAERFRREARTAASLNHPHVIPIYAVRERSNLLYFVMKFVAGQSLDPILKTMGALPIPMAQVILAQAASALGYAHRRGVIHRDVKPANIMLDDDGWVVMTDFGIAKVPAATGLTMTGVTVGTPAYMSPEQCMGHEVTGASDQYSLGVVAYEMLAGRKPFIASTAMAMMYAHFNEEPRPLRELRPQIPPELEASVMRMLAKEPEHRWAKIDDAFGAPPLAHDDPTRQQLISLAQTSPNATMAARISTPTSPVPPVRKTTREIPVPGATEPMAATPPASGSGAPTSAPPAGPRLTGSAPTGTAPVPTGAGKRSTQVLSARAPERWRTWLPWSGGALAAIMLAVLLYWIPKHRTAGGGAVDSARTATSAAPSQPPGPGVKDTAGKGGAGAESKPVNSETNPPAPPPAPVVTVGRILLQPTRLILDVGQSGRLTPQLRATDGTSISDLTAVTWRSSAAGIATVDSGGVVRGVAAGRARITASVEKKTAAADITVRPAPTTPTPPAPVAAITVAPDSATLTVGRTISLDATLVDARGATVNGRASWSSSDPGVASVSTSGQVQGRAPGTAVITAAAEGRTGTAVVKVMAMPVASVKLSGSGEPLKVGQTSQLTAAALDGEGNQLADRKASWASSDTKVATVSPTGLVTAQAPGTATVTATIEGRTGSVAVSVLSPAPDPAAEQQRAVREMTQQLDAFVEALNALDLAKLKSAYPGMPHEFEEGWRKMLTNPKPERLRASHDPLPAPRITGDAAEMPFTLHMHPEYPGTRAPNVDISYLARFQLEDGKWRLLELQRK